MLAAIQTFVKKGLFYKTCLVCTEPASEWLCESCHGELVPHIHRSTIEGHTLLTFSKYTNPVVQKLLHRIKFSSDPLALTYLSDFVTQSWSIKENYDLAIPIPLHPKRQKNRGFNQVKELFLPACERHAIPLYDLLKRTKNTLHLSLFERADRQAYIRDIFDFKSPLAAPFLRNKHVLLLDDIVTSGATLKEALNCLRQAGVRKVTCSAIARSS